MRIRLSICFLLFLSCSGFGQTRYELPFASAGNVIELTIANAARQPAQNLQVMVADAPAWVHFASKTEAIAQMDANAYYTLRFKFSVDRTAPVNKEETITLAGRLPNGQVWTRDFRVAVKPPEQHEAFQNYPNPFNPTTTISYQLRGQAEVSLKIYSLVGQGVAELFEGTQPPGYHQHVWDATNVASGTYFYRLTIRDNAGSARTYRKMMQVVK